MMANLPKQGQTTWTKRQSQTSLHHRRCELVYVEELTTTRVVQQRHSVFSRCIFLSPSFFLSLSLSLCLPTTTTKAICLFQAHFYTCRFSLFSSTATRAVSFRPISIIDCVFKQSSGNVFSCCSIKPIAPKSVAQVECFRRGGWASPAVAVCPLLTPLDRVDKVKESLHNSWQSQSQEILW